MYSNTLFMSRLSTWLRHGCQVRALEIKDSGEYQDRQLVNYLPLSNSNGLDTTLR
jgi:hypothetical protein